MPKYSFKAPRIPSIFEIMHIIARSDVNYQDFKSPEIFSRRLRPENSSNPLLKAIVELAIDIKQDGYQLDKDPLALLIETINIEQLPKIANSFEAILFKNLYSALYNLSNTEKTYCLLRADWENVKADMVQHLKNVTEMKDWQEELGIKYATYDDLAFFSEYIPTEQVALFSDVFKLEIYDIRIENERCQILADLLAPKVKTLPKTIRNADDQRILAIYSICEGCTQDIELGNDPFFKFAPISVDMIEYCAAYEPIAETPDCTHLAVTPT